MDLLEYRNKDWLIKQFDKFKTVTNVADQTGYPRTCITRYAKKFNIYNSKYTRAKVNTVNESYFEIIDTSEKAYWLGFIMADGNIYKYKDNNKLQFSIKLKSTDILHLEKFKEAINFSGEVKQRSGIRNGIENKACEIKIYNKIFCNNLIVQGIVPNKTGKEFIPDTVHEDFYIDFIRGFIDGDGTITGSMVKGKILKVSLCSTNNYIIEQIKNIILDSLKIEMHTNLYKTMYTLSCTKKFDNYKLLNSLYYDNCVGLNRKYNLALTSMLDYENIYM